MRERDEDMSDVLIGREPVAAEVGAPLIELAGVEKVYRTGRVCSSAFVFPPVHLVVTLVGTIVPALLVRLAPVRRAVRFKPGEALRYA
jgi:hypothetical protein